jgi:predicted dehydrogenase
VSVACFAPTNRNEAAMKGLGVPFHHGKLADAVAAIRPSHAIVATPVETLASATLEVLAAGIRSVLVEKPAFLSLAEARELVAAAKTSGARAFVAYNRRFYASVRKARDLIRERSESFRSVFFEFTEWTHKIEPLQRPAVVKSHWVLANSAHVIDLALHAVGRAQLDQTLCVKSGAGALAWHPSAAVMTGAGITDQRIPFAYLASWGSPGRWGVEWITDKTRYIFRPLEGLKTQGQATIAIEDVELPDDLDQRFKPGVFHQDRAFLLEPDHPSLASLEESASLGELVCRIAGY